MTWNGARTEGILPSKRREAPILNEAFGTQLCMSFVISPSPQVKTDLVTLRLTSPVLPRQFLDI